MLLLAIVLKGLAEVVLLVMLGQGILHVLAGGTRDQNLVYRMFATVTRPLMRAARAITPRFIVDQHIWLVALFLVILVWVLALALKVHFVLQAGVRAG
jgi:hypothetical protein